MFDTLPASKVSSIKHLTFFFLIPKCILKIIGSKPTRLASLPFPALVSPPAITVRCRWQALLRTLLWRTTTLKRQGTFCNTLQCWTAVSVCSSGRRRIYLQFRLAGMLSMTLQQCFINCCMEEEPGRALQNLLWGKEGCSHSLTYSLGCAFALESLAICHGWAGSGLHSHSMTCVFHTCRSSNLFRKLQLCWKSRQFGPAAEGPVDRPLLLDRDGICRGRRKSCTRSPSSCRFLESRRLWVQSEEGNIPTPGLAKRKLVRKGHKKSPSNLASESHIPFQSFTHYRPLGSGTPI